MKTPGEVYCILAMLYVIDPGEVEGPKTLRTKTRNEGRGLYLQGVKSGLCSEKCGRTRSPTLHTKSTCKKVYVRRIVYSIRVLRCARIILRCARMIISFNRSI